MQINYTTGYAGTGKSTKLIDLIHQIDRESLVVIAPTHKALERLRPHLPQDTEIKTVHSLLGWIPYINEKAKHINYIQSIHKLEKPLDQYTTIVIDEAGMLSEDMLTDITSKIEEATNFESDNITLHLFLDPYQLLPVNGQQIQTDPLTTTDLTTQYRSDAPDIVETYTKFVHYLQGINTKDLSIVYSQNIKPLDIKQFRLGDRLLAYTNDAVGEWNRQIAQQMGITSYIGQEVQLGVNSTTVVKQFVTPILKDLVETYKSGQLLLQNSRIKKEYLEQNLYQLLHTQGIEFIIDSQSKLIPVIVGIGKANRILKQVKQSALKTRSNFKYLYALNRAFIMDYTFASTVHKAQGSEFNTVFIDREDIKKSIFKNYYMTYARLLYVALSRAIKTIYITS